MDDHETQVGSSEPTTLDYASPPRPAAADPPPKNSTLCWLSLPALAGAALMGVAFAHVSHPFLDPNGARNLLGTLAAMVILSGITSGAIVLSVLDSRKTVANVTILSLNLAWLLACLAWFLGVRIG